MMNECNISLSDLLSRLQEIDPKVKVVFRSSEEFDILNLTKIETDDQSMVIFYVSDKKRKNTGKQFFKRSSTEEGINKYELITKKEKKEEEEQKKLAWKKETMLKMNEVRKGEWIKMTEAQKDETLEQLYTVRLSLIKKGKNYEQ